MNKDDEEKILVALMKYKRVKLGKFGIFELREIPARNGWDPIRKEKKNIAQYTKVAFKPLKNLKLYVNKMDTTK
jgi:nucleoid DNA-binding protein